MSSETNAVIKRAQAGDRQAFAQLVEQHYDLMFRAAFKWCGNRSDAEDVAQNACIKLATSIGGFSFKAAFTSWLYRLVITVAIDWQRQNRREKTVDDYEVADGASSAEDQLHAREMLHRMNALGHKEKAALILVYSEGLSHGEAARVMDCKESTVSWHIHEARKKLAAMMTARKVS